MTKILVTGGAGFIGSAVIRHVMANTDMTVINIDKLTYAGDLRTLGEFTKSARYSFEKTDICDRPSMRAVFDRHRPDWVIHLAAESHVDRSIDAPGEFIQTNIIGTYTLLQVALDHWHQLDGAAKNRFRFLHVSTDEVFGELGVEGLFSETSPYAPNSPYAASKAASDHLVRAWHRTYGLPTLISNCSNNFGPYQFPEKFIPLIILNGLAGKPLPLYGRGENVRDWIFVDDHARALVLILMKGRPGESYNVGARNERSNFDVACAICRHMDALHPRPDRGRYGELITFVADRPGHDFRYAIDCAKVETELDFKPSIDIETGFQRTVKWYIDHEEWWHPILTNRYSTARLGVTNETTP